MDNSETCEALETIVRILKNDCKKCRSFFKLGGIERCSAEKNRDPVGMYFKACSSIVSECEYFKKKKKE